MKMSLLLLLAGISCFSQDRESVIGNVMQEYPLSSFIPSYYLPMSQAKLVARITAMLTGDDLAAMLQSSSNDKQIYAATIGIAAGKYNAADAFLKAYHIKKDSVAYMSCTYATMPLHELYYSVYETKLWEDAQLRYANEDEAGHYNIRVKATDSQLMAMDSIIVMNERHPYLNSYCDVLENRKYPDVFLPRIEHLAFKEHFSCALAYLQRHYPDAYAKRIDHYWREVFPHIEFSQSDDYINFRELLNMLIYSGNADLKQIGISKIRSVKVTKDNMHWIKDLKELINTKS